MSASRFDLSLETKETLSIAYQELSHIIDIDQDAMTRIGKLRIQRQNILKCISLLNWTLRKRDLVIQVPMLVIMVGTLGYMLHESLEYDDFKHKADFETDSLVSELKFNLTRFINETMPVVNRHQRLQDLSAQRMNSIHTAMYTTYCYSSDLSHLLRQKAYSCHALYQDPTHIFSSDPMYNCESFDRPNPCHPGEHDLIGSDYNNCIGQLRDYCRLFYALASATPPFEKVRRQINAMSAHIAGIDPHYEDFYSAFAKSVGLYYFITVGLGEISPFAVIALTLLTHVFSDRFSLGSCFNLSEQDVEDVVEVADEAGIKHENLTSYKTTLGDFQTELKEVNQELYPSDCRLAVCMADNEINAKKTPISLLFHSKTKNKPFLLREIFELAGLNPPPTGKERAALAMREFELRSADRSNMLYSFFNRVTIGKGVNSAEQIQQKIYQYAGFVPR